MDNDSREPRGQRDEEHSSGYEQHEVPATSQTAPTSHGDPERFFRNHPPVVWWIMGGIGVFVLAGLIGAWLVVRDEGDTDPLGASASVTPGVSVRGSTAVAGSAVAGAQAPAVVLSVRDGVFDPKSVTVARGGQAVFTVGSGTCDLVIEENSTGRTLSSGQSYTWNAEKPGDYDIACKGHESDAAYITVP